MIYLSYASIIRLPQVHKANLLWNDQISNLHFRLQTGMSTSIHGPLLIHALSMFKGPSSFLEIGTFDGSTTMAISRLFPFCQCLTLDLPLGSSRLNDCYGINDPMQDLLRNSRQLMNSDNFANVDFIEMSSIHLPSLLPNRQFDVIWIDGDHNLLSVFSDLHYSLYSTSSSSIIFLDDVDSQNQHDPTLTAIHTLQQEYNIEYILVQKRSVGTKAIAIVIHKGSTPSYFDSLHNI